MIKKKTRFIVKGGKPLYGQIRISGAKNSASKLLISSLLTDAQCKITNCPAGIGELLITRKICEALGAKFSKWDKNEVIVQTRNFSSTTFSVELGLINRIGILTTGPLLNRTGEAKIPKLGGDRIGTRPINFHLDALRKLGAEIREYKNFFLLKANRLYGANINLEYPSVGATENIIISSCLAEGKTFIHNAAIEPEIIDLIKFLQKMGAIIDIHTNRTIIITGVKELNGAVHNVIPDRLEAASFACAAIASKGEVTLIGARQDDMITFLNSIRLIGADYEILDKGIRFFYEKPLKSIPVETDVHPGFMTDWQPPFTLLLTQAKGVSIVHETVYENRFGYVNELKKMGADIELYAQCLGSTACRFVNTNYKHSAVVRGITELMPAKICVPDIRAGFSYLIAALLAKGESCITGIEHIDRGYENIEEKFRGIGANIKRV
jgi:UDP-N-acetylglucosamine 1-carboxyvinyltransferase